MRFTFFELLWPTLLFVGRVEVLLRRAFVDGVAALATVQGVAGGCLLQRVGRRGLPLFDMGLTAFALFVLHGADGLAGQQRLIRAGPLGPRLHHSRLDIFDSRLSHSLPPEGRLPPA